MRPLNLAIVAAQPSADGNEWLEQYMAQEVAELVSRKSGIPAESVVLTQGHDPATEVSLTWSIHDVLSQRADLTDAEAREVLEHAARHHDAEIGLNWRALESAADDMHPRKRQVTGDLISECGTQRARLHMAVPEVVLLEAESPLGTPAGWLKIRYGYNGKRRVMLRVQPGGLVDHAQYHERRHLLVRIADGDA